MSLTARGLATNLDQEFAYRKHSVQRDSPVTLNSVVDGHTLRLELRYEDREFDILIPLPYEDEHGNLVVGDSVRRVVGEWQVGKLLYSYLEFIQYILCNRIDHIVEGANTMSSQIARLIKLHTYLNPAIIVRGTQRIIDTIVTTLPLSEHPMKDRFMNRRVTIVDPKFNGMTPQQKLKYQVAKQRVFFPWSSIGLADGSAAVNNYILKESIRPFTPFGAYDNPQRNLYSTLSMKGDEEPLVQTHSEACVSKAKRSGWNLMTLFLDDPDNFEDQIILSNRMKGKMVVETRRVSTYGKPLVLTGENIETGRILATEPNGSHTTFDVICEKARVVEIEETERYFNGASVRTYVIVVEVYRALKHGFKVTNRHGNKGVVTFADTGYIVDPESGTQVPIDVIVSARSVKKRKNTGQILEALCTTLFGKHVVPDNVVVDIEDLKKQLQAKGYPEDLTVEAHTFRGTYRGIAGRVFWGVIKTVEDQIWTDEDLADIKNNGMHRAGLKLSPIEFKALSTVFGKDRSIINTEIMEHASGMLEALEHLYVIRSGLGLVDEGLPKIHVKHIKPVTQSDGYFQTEEGFKDTIADIERFNRPFLMELPFDFYTTVLLNGEVVEMANRHPTEGVRHVFKTRYIYVPGVETRRPWPHRTGYLGMNETTTLLNNVVDFANRPAETQNQQANALTSVKVLLNTLSVRMSTKRGWLNQNILSVRYPHSAKAVATQNSELPANTVGIHKFMADQLGVEEGDVVIVERFPCLGFPSMRLQKVHIHEDKDRAYVIEVSGNSLVSQGLDFDGDVIYLMSFQKDSSKEVLHKHFDNPNPRMLEILDAMNSKVAPQVAELGFDDYEVQLFPEASPEYNAEIIENLAGVKLYTGPVIALAYNLLRIMEPHIDPADPANVAIELLVDRVANSVFSKKHGRQSLQEEAIKAVCLADVDLLMELFGSSRKGERARYQALGIRREDAERICGIIRAEASASGVRDLEAHYRNYLENGRSNVISTIVRRRRKIYFATRAALSPYALLENLYDEQCPDDLVAAMLKFRIGDYLGWNKQARTASSS